jgi:hypothetical protein
MIPGLRIAYANMILRLGPREPVMAIRCWRTGHPEPEGDSDLPTGTIPTHWFKEEPAFAAELYALECGIPNDKADITIPVSVRDERGVVRNFQVRLIRTIEAKVEEL